MVVRGNKERKLRTTEIAFGITEAELRQLLDEPSAETGIGTGRGTKSKTYYTNEVDKIMYESSTIAALCLAAHTTGKLKLSRDRQKSCFFIINHVAGMPTQKHEIGELPEPAKDYLGEIREFLRQKLDEQRTP